MQDVAAVGHTFRFALESVVIDLANERLAHQQTKDQLSGQATAQQKVIDALSSKPEAAELVKKAIDLPLNLWRKVLAEDEKVREGLRALLAAADKAQKGLRPVPDPEGEAPKPDASPPPSDSPKKK